ncbi:uncharacterized protein LOC144142110 [Haemaphysalis longicornis]
MAQVFIFLFTVLIFIFSSSDVGFRRVQACSTELSGVGPRQFSAKTMAGNVMRYCNKEILALARIMPPHKLRKTMTAFCEVVNACMDSLPEPTFGMVVDCYTESFLNESAAFYTKLHIPHTFGAAVNASSECLRRNNLTSVPYQVAKDGLAFWRYAVLAYGSN